MLTIARLQDTIDYKLGVLCHSSFAIYQKKSDRERRDVDPRIGLSGTGTNTREW